VIPHLWRPALEFPDYWVCWHGEVLSSRTDTILKPSGRYPRVSLRRDGVAHDRYIHRLVLESFGGVCPEGLERLHADGDNKNNWLGNLSYGTHEQNMQQCIEHGTFRPGWVRKDKCPQGHEYAGDNLYISPSGTQVCKRCNRDAGARWRQRKRNERSEP
jgi:hypothetical protein